MGEDCEVYVQGWDPRPPFLVVWSQRSLAIACRAKGDSESVRKTGTCVLEETAAEEPHGRAKRREEVTAELMSVRWGNRYPGQMALGFSRERTFLRWAVERKP